MFLDSVDKLVDEFCVSIATDRSYFKKILCINNFIDSEISPKLLFEYLTCKKSDFVVVHSSRLFQPESEEKWFGEKYLYLGNRFDTEIPPSNADFYHNAKIYISLGTIFNGDQNLIIQLIDYFKETKKYEVVFSTGGNDYIATKLKKLNLPSNITIVRYIDQHNELSKTALFISHSGLNSIYESLYFTVPLILIPQMTEHAVNAKRAEELGVGYFIRNNGNFVEELALAMEDMNKNWRIYKDNTVKLRDNFLKSDGSLSIARKICYIAKNSGSK
jgi:MGT family glycosyltransferase